MEYAFRHSMRGRVRLNIPALRTNRRLGDSVLAWLRAQTGIKSARINYDCASLVLEYDAAQEAMLMLLLERLKNASLAEVRSFCTAPAISAPANKAPEVSKDLPLALPTLSLAMAFSTNPVLVALNMPLMLYNAIPIAKRAWKVWANESRLNIDVLDTLAISSSVLQGNPLAGCIVTWLIKLGDWIRDLTAAGSRRAISELLEFQTRTAWLLRDGKVDSVPAAELKVDDVVVVYPGEMIPVDGEIIGGHATIDQKTITGEGRQG
jgi:cation transport ATPase